MFLMKIKNLKYILCLICLSFFVWCSIASQDVSSPNSCNLINPDHSTNPANNSGNVNNQDWYYNSSEWMIWWYNVHTSSTPIQWNISDIIGYKLTLLKKFDGAAWNSSPSSVWHLQNALKIISTCTTVNRDCKLWTVTNASFFGCNICKWIDSSYEQPVSLNSSSDIVCLVWYEKVTEWSWANLCCKEEEVIENYTPGYPTITNTNPNWENNKAHVLVKYGTDDPEMFDHWWEISILTINWNWASMDWSSVAKNTGALEISFDVNVTESTESITVNAWEWLVVFTWNAMSLQWSQTFNRPLCSFPATPPTSTWTCSSWFQNNWAWCCQEQAPCTWNQYQSWSWGCQDCTWDTMPSADRTKCVCNPDKKCCWIQLNTVVPFIWDCIEMNTDSSRWDTTSVTSVTAFPVLVQWLMKILMSAIMVFSFLMVIVAGLMMTTWAFSWWSFTKWKTILKNVIISLILLWCSWLILSLVNPSFFGG